MSRTRLTDARVRDLRPKKATRNVRETVLAGFGVRVLPSGRQRFFIHSQHEGRRIWKIVGDPADVTVAGAREKARGILASIRAGRPPSDEETLFEAVAERAFRRHGRNWKESTLSVNRHYLRNQILPWFRGWQVAGITSQDVRDWFASLHATPVAADRSMPVLSVIMKVAEADGLRPEGSNPCREIRRYRRQKRDRFLSDAEFGRLGRALREAVPCGPDRPAPCADRLPVERGQDPSLGGLPRRARLPARRQDGSPHSLAVVGGPRGARRPSPHVALGVSFRHDRRPGLGVGPQPGLVRDPDGSWLEGRSSPRLETHVRKPVRDRGGPPAGRFEAARSPRSGDDPSVRTRVGPGRRGRGGAGRGADFGVAVWQLTQRTQ